MGGFPLVEAVRVFTDIFDSSMPLKIGASIAIGMTPAQVIEVAMRPPI
jgi:hypothetical protein